MIYILAFFPIFDFKLINLSILLFIVGSYHGNIGNLEAKLKEIRKNGFGFAILSLPFFLSLISLLWTTNLKIGLSFVERSLPIFIIPFVVLYFKPFHRKSADKFISLYILSNALLALVVLVYATVSRLVKNPELKVHRDNFGNYFRDLVEGIPIVGEHPIYLSLLIGSALLFLYYYRFKHLWINLTIASLFLIVLFVTGSRGPIVALLVASCSIILLLNKSLKTKIVSIVTVLLIIVIGGLYSPLKERVSELVNTKHLLPQGDYFNSFNTRMGIYKCSFEIGKKTPWYGLGPGDVQYNLDSCYDKNYDTNAYGKGIFNTHNQYLFYWLSFGFLGLLLIIGTYVLFFKQAFLSMDRAYVIFLVYLFFCFFFENILSRNTGIMLFSIFNTILYQKKFNK
ncbi:O-antigen ligase family protein [Flagellimonas sp.]|uniref:O-antigen ligase family protein n=1 Tax=Flagellimonas sp. TaxID=2058762 RepID=UPI003F4A1FAD